VILSTSVNYSPKRAFLVYMGAAAFCFIFFLIYHQFDHGVTSPYMTYAFLIPLLLGGVPTLFFIYKQGRILPGLVSCELFRSGIASVTVSSILKGIFEIAGTSSPYQRYLMVLGVGLLICGFASFLVYHPEGVKVQKA